MRNFSIFTVIIRRLSQDPSIVIGWIPMQNVPRHNVPGTKHPKTNVPGTKHHKTKHPKTKRPRDKTSQDKTSQDKTSQGQNITKQNIPRQNDPRTKHLCCLLACRMASESLDCYPKITKKHVFKTFLKPATGGMYSLIFSS